ncbi:MULTISPECIES: hypothetical protein [Flavobacteriaceae]|uniref:hypothetical protein n=1 Tax=Flavobacteriaceae TaxID=49546 RepID=UPI001493154E|nr:MULTISPECIES: hypothetical protein [Allomuricauda]MDC6366658.1 hypothetical protein [Muricauda sp. AC10]
MIANKRIWGILLFALLFIGCSSGSDGGDDTPPPSGGGDDDPVVVPAPTAATLVFPEDDTECNEGNPIDETESNVTFQWGASQNTDSYSVTLTNLHTNSSFNTIANTNEATISILRGTPYEWYVTSRANGTNETAESTKWQFFNEGPGIENHAPFPVEAVSPSRGETLSQTSSVTLTWSSSDIDNDISSYDVFFGTQTDQINFLGNTTENLFEATVSSGNIYYWQVKVIDSEGNSSTSVIFEFRID